MNGEELCRSLREMMPSGVCVAAGGPLAMPLTARERASLGAADAARIREFESGRAYAKRALAMLGIDDADLPIGPDRSPVWPSGVVGSISHVRCGRYGMYAAAAVARTEVAFAVGIDLETEDGLRPDDWPYVLTQRELVRILGFPARIRRREVHYIWCAKEATAKIVRQRFDPAKLEVERDPKSGDFIAGFLDNNGRCLRGGIFGRTARLEPLLIATAVVPEALRTAIECYRPGTLMS
jgi:4'-phosphopantetheinyl transferase EntD